MAAHGGEFHNFDNSVYGSNGGGGGGGVDFEGAEIFARSPASRPPSFDSKNQFSFSCPPAF